MQFSTRILERYHVCVGTRVSLMVDGAGRDMHRVVFVFVM